MKPVLVDLNRDGALDLAYSCLGPGHQCALLHPEHGRRRPAGGLQRGQRHEHQAAGPGHYSARHCHRRLLPYTRDDMPCFTDVDNDGYVDLLIGTNETARAGHGPALLPQPGPGPAGQRLCAGR